MCRVSPFVFALVGYHNDSEISVPSFRKKDGTRREKSKSDGDSNSLHPMTFPCLEAYSPDNGAAIKQWNDVDFSYLIITFGSVFVENTCVMWKLLDDAFETLTWAVWLL